MKKISVWLIAAALLFITGCTPNVNDEEVLQNDEAEEQTSIVPSYQLSEENYKMILPYRPSEARGVITNQIANRLDIDEMEEGLRRHSKAVYDPGKYFFEEGQYLKEDMVYQLITDLNPKIEKGSDKKVYEENPRYLSHILEQNFVEKQDDNSVELVGMSIGLALKSVYRFQTKTGGPYYYEDIPQSEMMEQGNEIAQEVVERIREMDGLQNIPIMIALYREQESGSPVPGNFVAKTNVAGGSASIGGWDEIDEENILFPSSEGREKYFDDHETVTNFGNEVAQYFPNYVGVIGDGFYINGELQKLTIEIPIEFYGKGEVVGFTQYTYGLVLDMFPDYFDLEINIKSSNKMESLIYREAGAESPTVHIFH
ncbi:CamS family sex pheromone protein [Virgibacillus sp. C22-A2]|uniref:CamS family sex pheromone protein n=1 Tax=Virgibacillus tibetensis TaxID=3042313 RepID=A0ABU6KGQ9_9BACI|nr:CamS family sex pheromone protein [Virgibacillus sp. C22-A2]